ncbi:MAG: hypothetical protein ACRDPW_07650 [Mycobacteriales bacterium]
MTTATVTVSDLIHHTKQVFEKLKTENQLTIMRNGEVAGILTAPDPDDVLLDKMAAAGEVPTDWRERQARLRELLRAGPLLKADLGKPSLSETLTAMRDEETR